MPQFQKETGAIEAIQITMICGTGYRQNKYSVIVQNVIVGDDLFGI